MDTFASYIADEKLYETRHKIIYRGRHKDNHHRVIIKVLKTRQPSSSEVARFKQEFSQLTRLHIPGVVGVLDLVADDHGFAMVEADVGGVSLKTRMNGEKIAMDDFLEKAVSLAHIMGYIHKNKLIHMDIKPSNIIVNGKDIHITDFGLSAILTHANDELYHADVVLGSLLYMSPEMTGRMNRGVDYRTDMYSLGVLFYQMAVGDVPFKSNDPMEIIHAHIARPPTPPVELNPALPVVVSDMILKLLAKTPEERYQNGFGLAADLEMCLHQFIETGQVSDFPLAGKDFPIKFHVPQILVGREDELKCLLGAFEAARESTGEIMLVLGRPGIGKSALVNEIHKPIVAKKGYFLFGKFDQFKKEVPYSAIIQAFQGFMRQILAESETRLHVWREDLNHALGANAKVISAVIPELELIVGEQPPVPELPPEESQNRFNLVFRSFIRVFTTKDRLLSIFIDDLQWADMASLKLIKTIMTGYEAQSLFFIGAYRDNEVQDHHPLSITLNEIRGTGKKINSIRLVPLSMDHVNRIIMNSLRCGEQDAVDLARLVHQKTGGNPFFVNQFLKNLYDGNYIGLGPRGTWTWDMDQIAQMEVTDNVVELLADKIVKLPKSTMQILQICACIGNRFDLEALSVISEKTIEDTLGDLSKAIYHDMVGQFGDMYKFHHDRIQEAAYSLISSDERVQMHYKIGRTVLGNTGEEALNEKIFYIVDQLNRGIPLITDMEERHELAALNLVATKKAKNSTAYSSALSYAKTGIHLLPSSHWRSHYDLSYQLFMERITCEYLMLNFDDAVALFYEIIKNSSNNVHKAKAYTLMIILYTNQGNYGEALRLGLEGCRLIGFSTPRKVGKLSITFSLIKLYFRMGRMKIEDFANLPIASDEEFLAYDDMQIQTGTVGYYVDANLFCYIVIYGVTQILTYGNSFHSPLAYCALGSIIGTGLNLYDAAYRFGLMALKIDDEIVGLTSSAKIKFMFTMFIQHWKKHAKYDVNLYRDSYKIGVERGDMIYSSHSINMLGATRIMIGDNLDDVADEYETYRHFQFGSKDPFMVRRYMENIQLLKCLKGVTRRRGRLDDTEFSEEKQIAFYERENNLVGMYYLYLTLIRVRYFFGQYTDCLAPAEILKKLTSEKIATGSLYVPEANFFSSLSVTALYLEGNTYRKRSHLAFVRRNQKNMKAWAKSCPENFLHKYLLVEGELARCRGKHEKAMKRYMAAIRSAHANGYVQNEGIAYERAALLAQELNRPDTARRYLKQARRCFARYGASDKVRYMDETYTTLAPYPADGDQPVHGVSPQTGGGTRTLSGGADFLDLTTVIKASQSLSGEVDLVNLLEKIIALAIENAGAQRGYLLLKKASDGKLYIEALGEVDEPIRVFDSKPLTEEDMLSLSIVNYVNVTSENIVLSDASQDHRFINDPYIEHHRPKSLLCAPIIHKGQTAGILYLENNSVTNAFIPERLVLLRILSAQAAISIENSRLIADRENAVKLHTEMKIAANIQTVLLPEKPAIHGFDIAAYMDPADEVGGDYYDVINTPEKDWVVIGDVSGHGVHAGLVMMMVQTAIQTIVRNDPSVTPSSLLSKADKSIKHNIIQMKEDKYMSITALSFQKDGTILFSGLHQDILLYRADTGVVEEISPTGIWLSPWDMGENHHDQTFSMAAGDILFLYTDGITEAKNKETVMFTEEGLIRVLKSSGHDDAAEIRDHVLADLEDYQVKDDITMVILKKVKLPA